MNSTRHWNFTSVIGKERGAQVEREVGTEGGEPDGGESEGGSWREKMVK